MSHEDPRRTVLHTNLAALVQDLREALDWEQRGGATGFPATPREAFVLPALTPVGSPAGPARGERRPTARPAAPARPAERAPGRPEAPRRDPAGVLAPRPAPSPSVSPAATPELAEVAAAVLACRSCPLGAERDLPLPGQGGRAARVVVVVEAPGMREEKERNLLAGPAGELLQRILLSIQLDPADVFVCPAVKCRPPRNRTPTADEVAACRPYLQRQIASVAPRVIVAFGETAALAVAAPEAGGPDRAAAQRGRDEPAVVGGVPVVVTHHHGRLLRTPELKRDVWADMKRVRAILDQETVA